MPYKRIFILVLVIVPLLAGVLSLLQLSLGGTFLTLNLEQADELLTLSGRTNLVDRAILSYEIVDKDQRTRVLEGVYASGVAVVKNGRYSVTLKTTLFPPGELEVIMRFPSQDASVPQPPEVYSKYGRNGRSLSGSDVVKLGDERWVEKRESFILVKKPLE